MEISADTASPAVRALASSGTMNATGDRLSALMERCARGEDRVFEQLYGLLAPRLYRCCVRLANSVVEADDCFQEGRSGLGIASMWLVSIAVLAAPVYAALTVLQPLHSGAADDVSLTGVAISP